LEKTHYAGYKRFRAKQPLTPIIMASKPDWDLVNDNSNPEINEKRMRIIENTYLRAKAEGDENVYFVNGFTDFYPSDIRGDCTADGCHPNDLGYHYMAEAFAKVIKNLL
jgi:lysophospholipase L1-like esterase